MGESSPSLLSGMWFLLALPALVAGQCQVNLDKVNGKYPPLLLQNSQFIFPTEKVGEERVLNFEEADFLDLFCHGGSDEKQARIFVRRSDKSKKDSKVSLTCKSGEFFVSGSEEKVAVEKATCNQKQEPRLDRKQEQCAPVGDDGRTDKLESLQRVSIGWQIEGTFIEQIGICIDESNFGTIWTSTLQGSSLTYLSPSTTGRWSRTPKPRQAQPSSASTTRTPMSPRWNFARCCKGYQGYPRYDGTRRPHWRV